MGDLKNRDSEKVDWRSQGLESVAGRGNGRAGPREGGATGTTSSYGRIRCGGGA